jgi:hypothetical protein
MTLQLLNNQTFERLSFSNGFFFGPLQEGLAFLDPGEELLWDPYGDLMVVHGRGREVIWWQGAVVRFFEIAQRVNPLYGFYMNLFPFVSKIRFFFISR